MSLKNIKYNPLGRPEDPSGVSVEDIARQEELCIENRGAILNEKDNYALYYIYELRNKLKRCGTCPRYFQTNEGLRCIIERDMVDENGRK